MRRVSSLEPNGVTCPGPKANSEEVYENGGDKCYSGRWHQVQRHSAQGGLNVRGSFCRQKNDHGYSEEVDCQEFSPLAGLLTTLFSPEVGLLGSLPQ